MSTASDPRTLDANYCPHCGRPVQTATASGLNRQLDPGVYESDEAHLEVTGAEVRIYRHGGDGDGA